MGYVVKSGAGAARRRWRERGERAVSQAERLEPRTLLAFAPLGPEFRVNTFNASEQTEPSVASDADGDYVVAWQSDPQDGSAYGIYAQRYNAAGAPQGSEFRVNTTTAGNQNHPSVAMDADGDFVVAWASYPLDRSAFGIYAQRYNAAGVPQGGEFAVSFPTATTQAAPSVAADADGNFVVAWESTGRDGSGVGVFARRFNVAGVAQGNDFRVNTFTVGDQNLPAVAVDAYGNSVVTWMSDGQDGSARGVYAQRYNASGVPQGPEFRVNTTTANQQGWPSVAADADGDFVVTWQSLYQDGSNYGIYAQRYNAAGVRQGGEFRVNTTTAGNQGLPWAAIDADGDFIVAWESNASGGSDGIYAQRYNAAGAPQGGETRVNTTAGRIGYLSVAVDADGDSVVAWEGDPQGGFIFDIYAQRFDDATDTAGPIVTDVNLGGAHVSPGQVVPAVQSISFNFSERMSTLGGAAGSDSVTNPGNWGLGRDGADISSAIGPISFSYNAGTHKYEAVLALSQPMLSGNYILAASDGIRDVAANALDGDRNGIPGGTFYFMFAMVNDPPTTVGIPSVVVAEDQNDTVISLFDAFSDTTDADSALSFDVTANSNPGLLDATRIDPTAGTLTLDYAPNANGEAQITVRATDTAGQAVATTFTVSVIPVNDAPVNTVPGVQVARPGQVITFGRDFANAITVSDVDNPKATVTVLIEKPTNVTVEVPRPDGVDVKLERSGLRITGPIPNVNAALNGLRVFQVDRKEEQDALVVTTDDLGSSGLGGPMSDQDVIPLVFANAPLLLTIGDVTVAEGDAGTTNATFTVRLSDRPPGPVSVHYATADGSATVAGDDYQPAQGQLDFSGVETEKTVTVVVNGDIDVEGDEQFFVNLSNASGALIGDAQAVGTIANDDAPRPPPVVTQVFVSGSGWTAGYKNYLQAQSLGDATFGYTVPAGAAQLNVLPWGNVNRVSIRFNTDVLVLDQDLAVRGVRASAYGIGGFDYDDATHTATWTLSQPVVNDKLMLDLNGGPDGIVSPTAVALDGDWASGTDSFPSGDGTPGGSLHFRLNVLGGDVTRDGKVTYFDWLELRRRLTRTAANPGPIGGATSYGAFYDPSGDGAIGTPDLLMVRRNLLRSLPVATPAATTTLGASLTSVTKELFGSEPIID